MSLVERDTFSGELAEINIPDIIKKLFKVQCGFVTGSLSIFITEDALRKRIAEKALSERSNWIVRRVLGNERNRTKFGFLVSYYLSGVNERRINQIGPDVLEAIIIKATNPTPANLYDPLLNLPRNTPDAQVNPVVNIIAQNLVTGIADFDYVKNKKEKDLRIVKESLRLARKAKWDDDPWSAVFIISVIRRVAIEFGMEFMNGRIHEGVNKLLAADVGHRMYVKEAYLRTTGPISRKGTYHAFRIRDRIPKIGDIIVQDRRDDRTMANVRRFEEIGLRPRPGQQNFVDFEDEGALHGDIIVKIPPNRNSVITVGGNLGDTVMRRRYPLDATNHLIVSAGQRYAHENVNDANNDELPNVPAAANVQQNAILDDYSTGRIFAILSPVPICHRYPCEKI